MTEERLHKRMKLKTFVMFIVVEETPKGISLMQNIAKKQYAKKQKIKNQKNKQTNNSKNRTK